jgi:hypothetical protein
MRLTSVRLSGSKRSTTSLVNLRPHNNPGKTPTAKMAIDVKGLLTLTLLAFRHTKRRRRRGGRGRGRRRNRKLWCRSGSHQSHQMNPTLSLKSTRSGKLRVSVVAVLSPQEL